jgi:hypothetical protein
LHTQRTKAGPFLSSRVSHAHALGRENASIHAANHDGFAHVAPTNNDQMRMLHA